MPRIKKMPLTKEYRDASDRTKTSNERADCSVKAISIATGVEYEKALEALTNAGRKPKQSTYPHQSRAALNALGFSVIKLDQKKIIAEYPEPHNTLQNVTTRHAQRFKKVWADLPKRIIMRTNDHMLAIVDGRVHDWSANRALRAKEIWAIEPRDLRPSEATLKFAARHAGERLVVL